MHPLLFIEEILRIILVYRYHQRLDFLPDDYPLSDLVSLARTCRAFKEPALDVLWMHLSDLSQLVRCLPSVCRVKDIGGSKRIYTLDRDLEPGEMDIVKAYARRVRVLVTSRSEESRAHLDPDTLGHLCRTSQFEPLFPSLRKLILSVFNGVVPLARHVSVPNLKDVTLFVSTSAPSSCDEFLCSLSSSSLAIQNMTIHFLEDWSLAALNDTVNKHIRHWTRLRSMNCPDINMDIDTFLHLSRTPPLTRLSFTLGSELIDQIESSNQVFAFPALKFMALNIKSKVPYSKFFTHIRLPALETIFIYYVDTSPSRDMIRSFARALQTACNHNFIVNIGLDGSSSWSPWRAESTTLTLDDILPFAPSNIVQLHIELDWIVNLKDADLLRIASDCPRMESLHINDEFGWHSAGITPACLVEVLRRCPSLRTFCIVLDTRVSQTLANSGAVNPLPSGPFWAARLADSIIEAESVPALAALFAGCMPLDGLFCFSSWDSDLVRRLHRRDWQVYRERWNAVDKMVKEILLERSMRSDRLQVGSL